MSGPAEMWQQTADAFDSRYGGVSDEQMGEIGRASCRERV